MKKSLIIGALAAILLVGYTPSASALSCLSIDMYLKEVVGDENIVIFEGKTTEKIEAAGYTAEVLSVSETLQGYVADTVMVYHAKNETWGYMCNAGPQEVGQSSIYIASVDNTTGKYSVNQRLDLSNSAIISLQADLDKEDVVGEVVEFSVVDKQNQLKTTITDLINEIKILLAELVYWQKQ